MHTKIAVLTAFALSSTAPWNAAGAASTAVPASSTATYTVRVADRSPDSVHVNATFLLDSEAGSMFGQAFASSR